VLRVPGYGYGDFHGKCDLVGSRSVDDFLNSVNPGRERGHLYHECTGGVPSPRAFYKIVLEILCQQISGMIIKY
jgi:hypothetical protein